MGRWFANSALASRTLLITDLLFICAAPVMSSLSFNGESYRNASGHWHVQATVSHKDRNRDSEFGLATRRWKYAVDFTTVNYGEDDSMQLVFKASVPPRRVGSDYSFYPGVGFYKWHNKKVDWPTAKKTCENEGTHLIIINSKAEAEVFKKVVSSVSDMQWVHIGFHDRFQEGQYTTVLGDPLSSTGYVEWYAGEPNKNDGENCGVGFTKSATLGDWYCTAPSITYFVCEQEL